MCGSERSAQLAGAVDAAQSRETVAVEPASVRNLRRSMRNGMDGSLSLRAGLSLGKAQEFHDGLQPEFADDLDGGLDVVERRFRQDAVA